MLGTNWSLERISVWHLAKCGRPIVLLSAAVFLGAALVTISVLFLIVCKMVSQLEQIVATKRRVSSNLFDLRRIIREHASLFPQSGLMLAFWLTIINLVAWLSGVALSLVMQVGSR